MEKVAVRVPGTTANCGPGFDSIGMACTIYNYLELELTEKPGIEIEVSGEGNGIIPSDQRNIALQAIMLVFKKVNWVYQGIKLKMINSIPLARGLGSSAAAIVSGLTAANELTGRTLTKEDILDMATMLEGHPDNVAPAIYGGITISIIHDKHTECLHFSPTKALRMVVAIPEFNLSTKAARQVLPKTILLRDVVFNVSRTALLVGALSTGDYRYLKYALEDKIHQPYRERLIPGMSDVFRAAVSNGAFGAVISGSGPCLIAFTNTNEELIGDAMVQAFAANNVKSAYQILDIDTEGAKASLILDRY